MQLHGRSLHGPDTNKQRSYQAALQNPGPLQSHCDAVEEDEDQHDVVEQLMGDDGLAEQPEPGTRGREGEVWVQVEDTLKVPHPGPCAAVGPVAAGSSSSSYKGTRTHPPVLLPPGGGNRSANLAASTPTSAALSLYLWTGIWQPLPLTSIVPGGRAGTYRAGDTTSDAGLLLRSL